MFSGCQKAGFLFCALLFSLQLFSQQEKFTKEQQNTFFTAEYLFEEKNYILALPLYLELEKTHENFVFFKYRIGVCYMNKPDEIDKAIFYLEYARASKLPIKDVLLYLGKTYLMNYEFDEAIDKLNLYLKQKVPSKNAREANLYISNAKNGIKLLGNKTDLIVANIGLPVNTAYVEYAPLVATDGTFMVFTYQGERSKGGLQNVFSGAELEDIYYEDIFISHKSENNWQTPGSIGDNLNTNQHDAAIALSRDGKKLFVYKSNRKIKGDIYMSKLRGTKWSTPEPLNKNINSKHWEGSCCLSSDETLLYFSSERPGGYGGKDIYRSRKMPDGQWEKAENLGATINSELDDDAPFIHPNGTTLFYSSRGHTSMGGYDIFSSELKNNKWSIPENLGFPVNSTSDDIFYTLYGNGTTGYFSSSRSGDFDIYSTAPAIQKEKAIHGEVLAYKDSLNESGIDDKERKLKKPGKTIVKKESRAGNLKENALSEVESRSCNPDMAIALSKEFKGKNLNDEKTYKEFILKCGKMECDNLTYKVQIAAFRIPENFESSVFDELGQPEITDHPDGIKRFTMREFATLGEAEAFRLTAIKKGIKDAWITAFYNEERKLLREVIESSFFRN